jgi:hypothetical protein
MNLPNFSNNLKPASEYMGWCAIGEVIGNLIGLLIPHTRISGANLGHISAGLFGGLYALGVLKKYKSREATDLNRSLLDIDKLFYENKITEQEREELMEICLNNYRKKLKG